MELTITITTQYSGSKTNLSKIKRKIEEILMWEETDDTIIEIETDEEEPTEGR